MLRLALTAFLTLLTVCVTQSHAIADTILPEPPPARNAPWQKESWPAAPLLVWSHPGHDGSYADAANWTENGRPAGRAPDRDTDVVLPAAEREYSVRHQAGAFRHLVVGRNARLLGTHNGGEAEAWGNVHVRDGGRIHFVKFVGERHTFFRLDGGVWVKPGDRANYKMTGPGCDYFANADHASSHVTHKLQVCKYQDASVELFGNQGVSDEIQVQAGRMIVSGEVRWNGVSGKGALEIFDGAAVELQSGGVLAPFLSENLVQVFNVNVYRGGTLQAGSPERPLVSDAYLLLGYTRGGPDDGRSGLYCAAGSKLRVYTEDPAKARLAISSVTSRAGVTDGIGRMVGAPGRAATDDAGIVLHLAGDADLGAVRVDYVRAGGLRTAGSGIAGLDAVQVGENSAGTRSRLLATATVDPDSRYEERRANKAWVLQRSRSTMEEYLARNYRPAITPIATTAGGVATVTIATKLGEEIRYTLDGSEPSATSPLFTGSVSVPAGATLKARAFRAGRRPSEVAEWKATR